MGYDYHNNNYFPLFLNKNHILLPFYFPSRILVNNNTKSLLKKHLIEFRVGSAGGGNQLRQPYLKNIKKKYNLKLFPNAEHMHFYSLYVGNYPELKKKKILQLCEILNTIR